MPLYPIHRLPIFSTAISTGLFFALVSTAPCQVVPLFSTPDLDSTKTRYTPELSGNLYKLDATLLMLAEKSITYPVSARDISSLQFSNGKTFGEVYQEIGGWPIVDITHRGNLAQTRSTLEKLGGVEILAVASTPSYDVISCRIRPDRLAHAAGPAGVRSMMAAIGTTGSVRSQGSANNQAEEALSVTGMRFTTFGLIQGSGISIGTLSDSVNQLDGVGSDGIFGIAESQATGDLPPNNKLNILSDSSLSSSIDEGRAMMELIYDIAPLASQYGFATAVGGKATFANGITALGNAGMDIINDDFVYFSEAIYQDDVVAQAVNGFVDNGGIYFALNHNFGTLSREFTWSDADNDGIAEFAVNDEILNMTLALGSGNGNLSLFWAEPYGNATNDLAVRVFFNGSLIASSTNSNVGADPYDGVSLTGSGAITVQVSSTTNPPDGLTYKLIMFDNGAQSSFDEYPNNFAGVLTPHAGTPKSIAIGAAPFFDPDQAEDFSGRGPFKQFFGPTGNAFPGGPVTYNKPDFLSIDNCNTLFFGNDRPEDADTFPNFSGTSAATPNAAAVGVLVLQAAGGPGSLTRSEMFDILKYTAEDVGEEGFDTTYGLGRINAVGAVSAALGVTNNPISIYPSHTGIASNSTEILDNPLDKDAFKIGFDADGDASFFVTRNSGDVDPMILLFNADDEVRGAAYDNSSGNVNGTLETTVEKGLYTIQAQPEDNFSTDSPYSITILGPDVAPDDRSLDIYGDGTVALTQISPVGDLDYFRFIVPNDITGTIEFECSSSVFQPLVRLFNQSGLPIASAVYQELANGGTSISTASDPNPSPGTEIVAMVVAEDYIGTGFYTLNIDSETGGIPDPLITAAISIAWVVRPNPVTGEYQTFNPPLTPGQSNHTLWVPLSSSVTVSSLAENANTFHAGLYDVAGNLLDADGLDFETTITSSVTAGAQNIYRFYAYDSPANQAFLSSNVFQESVAMSTVVQDLTFIPGVGNTVAFNVGGMISVQGENDYYKFTVPANVAGTGTLLFDSSDPFDGSLELYDSTGIMIDSIGDETYILAGLDPGEEYYMLVRGDKNQQDLGDATQTGIYKIDVLLDLRDPVKYTDVIEIY